MSYGERPPARRQRNGGGRALRDFDLLPVLIEDRSRCDWREAVYQADVKIQPTRATVTHRLRGAPTLKQLIGARKAHWATELRCPKTLFGRVDVAAGEWQSVEWDRGIVDGDMFVIPGLVATQNLRLRPAPNELTPIWDDGVFDVPKGWWLARGAPRRTKTLGQSLLTFRLDSKLESGRMQIEADQSEDDLCFHVSLAEDIWSERRVRHVQMAALIGALGKMGALFSVGEHGDGENGSGEPRVVNEIRQRLERVGVHTWDDPMTWDPALAATVIEPFRPSESTTPVDDE